MSHTKYPAKAKDYEAPRPGRDKTPPPSKSGNEGRTHGSVPGNIGAQSRKK